MKPTREVSRGALSSWRPDARKTVRTSAGAAGRPRIKMNRVRLVLPAGRASPRPRPGGAFSARAPVRRLLLFGQPRRGDVAASPFKERREIGHVGVAAVVLPPGQLAADERVDGGHPVGQVIPGRAEVLLPE